MSKKFKLLALTLACVTTLGLGAVSAFASAKTSVTVEDSFNDLNFEGKVDGSKWVASVADPTNPSIKQSGSENPSLQFVSGQSGGESVQYGTAEKAEGLQSVEFSLKMAEAIGGTEKWFAVNYVPALEHGQVRGSNHYYSPIMIDPRKVYVKGETQASKLWADLFPSYISEYGTIVETWVSFRLVSTSATTIDVYIALRGADFADTEFPALPQLTINGTRADAKEKLVSYGIDEDIDYTNSYVLFGSEGMGHGSHLDDIKITATSGVAEDDFTQVIRSEDLQTFPDGKLGTALKIADNNTLQFEASYEGDRVISKTAIKEETSIAESIVVFEASFRIKMAKNCSDEVAFVFGLDGASADPRQNGYAYVMGKDYGRVIQYRDGEVVYESDEENALIQVTSKKGADITLKVYKDCSVEVYEDGKYKATLPAADTYVGNVGFAALKNNSGLVDVDNVLIKQTSYYVPVTKSVTHGFDNSFFGNKGFEDFVKNGDGVYVSNGKLVFDHCADNAYFGSAHQYDSFIMDYQLCSINVSKGKSEEGRWLGLDVGRAVRDGQDYGSNLMLALYIVPYTGTTSVSLWSWVQEYSTTDLTKIKIQNVKPIPADLFRNIQYDNESKFEGDIKPGDAVCFRWVSDATNQNLKLYIKKASETDYTLYAEVTGLDAAGYQAIRCTGWTTFTIDNFSMANTSPIFELAPNQPPEVQIETETEIIYTKPDVDVNWEEEIRLNGTVKANQGANKKGCKGAVTGGAGLTALALVGACLIRRKQR